MFNYKQRGIYSEYLINSNYLDQGLEEEDFCLNGPSEDILFKGFNPDPPENKNALDGMECFLDYINKDLAQKKLEEENRYQKELEKNNVAKIEPKVLESYQPIPGRVPRKVDIDRKRKQFQSVNLKQEFENKKLNEKLINEAKDKTISWISLDTFDDKTYDDYSQIEWLEKAMTNLCEKARQKILDIKNQNQIKQKTEILINTNPSNINQTQSKIFDENTPTQAKKQKNFLISKKSQSQQQIGELKTQKSNIDKTIQLTKQKIEKKKILQDLQQEQLINSCGNCKKCQNFKIPVDAIWIRNNKFDIKRAYLTYYDKVSDKWHGYWEDNLMSDVFKRIFFRFQSENPYKWIERIQKAMEYRYQISVQLKQQFMIEKMKMDDLQDIDFELLKKIKQKSLNLKIISKCDIEDLVDELKLDFKRTMNQIIFKNNLSHFKGPFQIQNIQKFINEEKNKERQKYVDNLFQKNKGLIVVDSKRDQAVINRNSKNFGYYKLQNFNEIFKEFCFSSLFIKKESIQALQEVRRTCAGLKKMTLFQLKDDSSQIRKLDEFKTIQESAISQTINYLKTNFIQELINIIKKNFENIGKGWFNMKETNRLTYEFGKLKRFLTVIRLIMQDSLRELLKRSLEQFVQYFQQRMPENVEILNDHEIKNFYKNNEYKKPILSIDMVQVPNQKEFNFLFKADKIKADILSLFEKAVEELQKIPDLEPKILEKLHKAKKNDCFILTPILLQKKPIVPNPNIVPKRYPDENLWLYDLFQEFKQTLEQPLKNLEEYRNHFSHHEKLLELKPETILEKFEGEQNMNLFAKEIQKWKEEEKKLTKEITEEVQVSCFQINCKEAIRILIGKYQEINKKQIEMLMRKLKEIQNSLGKRLTDLEKDISKEPENIQELADIQDYVRNQLPQDLEEIKQDNEFMKTIHDILEDQFYKLSKDQLQKRWNLYKGSKFIMEIVEEKEKLWEKLAVTYKENLIQEKEDFKDSINNVSNIVDHFQQNSDITKHEQTYENALNLENKLKNMIQKASLFNHQEKLFECEQTDYLKIDQVYKKFQPFYQIWRIVNYWMVNFPLWMTSAWTEVNADSAEKFIDEDLKLFNNAYKSIKIRANSESEEKFNNLNQMLQVAKSEIDEFKTNVPLLVSLKQEGMQPRHWEEIIQKTKLKLKIGDEMNFEYLIQNGLLEHKTLCQDIGEKASRELGIEKSLNTMYEKWQNINFKLQPFKSTNSFVIINFDQIETILDNHLSDVQSLQVNPFKKVYDEQIEQWFEELMLVSNVMEEWKIFQSQWCYLQPIFDSPDINRQLPKEAALFKRVDSTWRSCISDAKVQKNVLKVCINEGLFDKFKEANLTFDKIQKELKTYLEVKRSKFGRFYFLSNDDLLSILSQTKEVEKVQDHLRKVFENIARLEFDQDKKIQAMFSVEKEKIKFVEEVDPNMKQVEDWMAEVEQGMMKSVRARLLESVEHYPKCKRNQWILEHPGQCVLNGSQIHWTQETEQAIDQKNLDLYIIKLEQQLKDLVTIDRSKLSKNQFITIEALIVIDVHAKDVVQKLIDANVETIQDFEWISQLRYYWENNDCYAKCLQTTFPYGYEYLGNSGRLVITPLTDICYMTLMSALKLNLGGAPAGPAGTGKTETTKDLAKALAKQCQVFNCQESMDYKFVAKFFKGLASAGAWCCFDEFNRINLEVLSVIAQQLQELFRSKAERLSSLNFEGSEIRIRPTFSVFITMNPGYAGRTELPDNLKALFRPVAMMVPNYALIAEIKLYSFGFVKARVLAKKMVATFQLSSEQLSSQYHYDYGMRAVNSVINAAGLFKRQDKDNTPEEILLLKALQDVNIPKFLQDDLPLFRSIIKDLFPDTQQPQQNNQLLQDSILQACQQLQLQPDKKFIDKIIQLYDTIQVRHGLMLVGQTGGGKSCVQNTLRTAISNLSKEHEQFQKINLEVINPKSISMEELYGEYKEMNWNEGIIEIIFQRAINNQFDSQKGNENFWIMFDGPVDALWIESMNTVLDDNKKLCLGSGKVLMLSNFMTMMFEVEDLSAASPATVSRCGMVYIEPETLSIQTYLRNYLQNSKNFDQNFKNLFKKFTSIFVEEAIEFQRKECEEICVTSISNLVQSFLNLFKTIIKDKENEFKSEEIQCEDRLLNCILFCSIWSIGCTVDSKSRLRFEQFLKQKILSLNCDLNIIENFYEYHYDFTTNEFQNWKNLNTQKFIIDPSLKFTEISVPTIDSLRMVYLMKTLIQNKRHVLTPGSTGSGKSTNAMHLMLNELDEQFISTTLVLSAQTKPELILETVFTQIAKRKKGLFGPAQGKKLLLFIDDLNMPKKEFYGAQPPIELLRQYLDYNSWFVMKLNKEQIKIEDLIILGAMGPSGGGRAVLSGRFKRHFNILTYTELQREVIQDIFQTILTGFMNGFNSDITSSISSIIKSTLNLYEDIKKELLPIPSKSHYQFNLRDISKVFSGVTKASKKYITTRQDFVALWAHENYRVFYDRLISLEDRQFFTEKLLIQFDQLQVNKSDIFVNSDRIIFSDFHISDLEREYCQVKDNQNFVKKLEEYQDNYNTEQLNTNNRMNLVLFLDACEHISRISRILNQPQGHALLLGVGGSGKQSLSKLSCFIRGYDLFQIEVSKGYNMQKWRDDIKKLIYNAIVNNKEICFLLTDNQIVQEEMLEDVNCLLNTGTIVNLPFNSEEMKKLTDISKDDCKKKNLIPNKINLQQQQVLRVRKNLHILMSMSPLGDIFWQRLRMFPALINCCTINWFMEWPEEALIGVAQENIEEFSENFKFKNPILKFVNFFQFAHKYIEKESIRYKNELKRFNYVTPTSFLSLLHSFRQILKDKVYENSKAIERLKNGIDRLQDANKNVEKLQEELIAEEPYLKKTQEEVSVMLQKIAIDKKEASEKKAIITEDEKRAKIDQEKAQKIADEVQAEVKGVEKDLEETLKEMDKLNQSHIVEINSFSSPPDKVKYVYMATCILMMDSSEIQTKNSWSDEELEDYYYKLGKLKLFKDTQFLSKLKGIDFEKVESSKIKKIKKLITNHPKRSKEWVKKDMKSSNVANYCIFLVVNAAFKYNELFKKTEPLRRQHQEVMDELNKKQQLLEQKNKELAETEAKLAHLEKLLNDKNQELNQLKTKIEACQQKLDRAKKLTELLSDEDQRWNTDVKTLEQFSMLIEGNSALAAVMLTYSGPFNSQFRREFEKHFKNYLLDKKILFSHDFSMRKFLGNPILIQQWNLAGLPKDETSIENGIIIEKTKKWPFLIDPQKQAYNFLINKGKDLEEGFELCKAQSPDLIKKVELCIQSGKWLLIENCTQKLESVLEPILENKVSKQGGSLQITIGEKIIPYSDKFKLFLISNLTNPEFSPETCAKVTVINFCITQNGLIEQMLAAIVILENRKLEDQKNQIMKKNAQDKETLYELENGILKTLSESSSNSFLENSSLIEQLAESKKTSALIQQRVIDSKLFEKKIDTAREDYRPLSIRVASLFFTVLSLENVESMYSFSLEWFQRLFQLGVELAPLSNDIKERLNFLTIQFTQLLYKNVARCLFAKHQILFSFLLCLCILKDQKKISEHEIQLLNMNIISDTKIPQNPCEFITKNSWDLFYKKLHSISQIQTFYFLKDLFFQMPSSFKDFYLSSDIYLKKLPQVLKDLFQNSDFCKLLFIQVFRPDKFVPAIQEFISKQVGREFVESPNSNLTEIYEDSTCKTPLVILLSQGSDPKSDFDALAQEKEILNVMSISLGQGQGINAERMILESIKTGGWVLLQNCHLASSWMDRLEYLTQKIAQENIHPEFRLWLTVIPDKSFPISVLQNSVRISIEPPIGVRATLLKSYQNFQPEIFDEKTLTYKKLLYGLCFFHSIVQNRKFFGPIGWNIPYQFTQEDLTVSISQLEQILEEYKVVPYKVLNFICAQINYGGRVTDDKDIRLLKSLLQIYLCPEILKDNYRFSAKGDYTSLPAQCLDDYIKNIQNFSINASPEIFGLHENAEITTNEDSTMQFLKTLKQINQSSQNDNQISPLQKLQGIIDEIEKQIPEDFDFDEVRSKYKTDYSESMNTVLLQEVVRYQRLLKIMKEQIHQLKLAIKGIQIMSFELEEISKQMQLGDVPESWRHPIGFLSLKPLFSWLQDLNQRVNFLQQWIQNGKPNVFWFSGFFFPQAFITGTLQNYARKQNIAIDELGFKFLVKDELVEDKIDQPPKEGVLINGIYLEGGRWDQDEHCLADPRPKELYSTLPILLLLPVPLEEKLQTRFYECPLYKVVSRTGQLSTTGHSTNFVMMLELPTNEKEDVWIRRGLAGFLSLKY